MRSAHLVILCVIGLACQTTSTSTLPGTTATPTTGDSLNVMDSTDVDTSGTDTGDDKTTTAITTANTNTATTNTATTNTATTNTATTTTATTLVTTPRVNKSSTSTVSTSTETSSVTSGTEASTVTSSPDSTTDANTTLSPNPTTTTSQKTTISSSTSTPSPTSTSTPSPTSTSTPSVTSGPALHTTTASQPEDVFLINEFTYSGLFAGGNDLFVEVLRISGSPNTNVTVVALSKDSFTVCESVMQFDGPWTSDLMVKTSMLMSEPRDELMLKLYLNAPWVNCTDYEGNMDAGVLSDVMVVSEGDKLQLPTVLNNTVFSMLIADDEYFKNMHGISVTRCENSTMNPGSFIISDQTRGKINNCTLPKSTIVKMTINNTDCNILKDPTTVSILKNYIARDAGRKCSCGLSPFLVEKVNFDCRYTTYTWKLQGVDKTQVDQMKTEYQSVLDLRLDERTCFDTEHKFCPIKTCDPCDHLPRKDNSNIKVTIGVVITCVVVFLVIVAVVIIVIRRKRRGILQFRMTRLDEDDDDLMVAPDTDDFVGGQDASFNNPTYGRFK